MRIEKINRDLLHPSGLTRPVSMVIALALSACFDRSDSDPAGETEGAMGADTDAASESSAASPTSTDGPTETSASMTGVDMTTSDTSGASTGLNGTESGEARVCRPDELLGCDGDELLRCNDAGNGELATPCALGCNEDELRCNDVDPSNGLAEYLEGARQEGALDLGNAATINTNDGTVVVDGEEVDAMTDLIAGTPEIRVLVVGSLVAQDVTVSGTPALAIVSDGDIQISGHFSLSASGSNSGPGALDDDTCQGGDQVNNGHSGNSAVGGTGGGGFGSPGGNGGTAITQGVQAAGGSGGDTIGNATLIPLRGGCNAGVVGASRRGAGGGAVQLVSRTSINVEGILAANGSSNSGGGSGGGILLEAPAVTVSGNVVANGGAGAGGGILPQAGEDGRTDAQPAQGGPGTDVNLGEGGNGSAGGTAATAGESVNYMSGNVSFAGHGGGGVGRIRVNVPDDGLTTLGIFSPNPTTGNLGTR